MIAVVRAKGPCTVVALRGEADICTRLALSEVLSQVTATEAGDVVIDLAEATFVDTATIRVLANAHEVLDQSGRRLTFRSPSRLAARLVHLFGLGDLIESGRGTGG